MGLHSGKAVKQMIDWQPREHCSDEMIKAFKTVDCVGSELKTVYAVFDTEGLLRVNVSLESSVRLQLQGLWSYQESLR
jgi:hypothetical protein